MSKAPGEEAGRRQSRAAHLTWDNLQEISVPVDFGEVVHKSVYSVLKTGVPFERPFRVRLRVPVMARVALQRRSLSFTGRVLVK